MNREKLESLQQELEVTARNGYAASTQKVAKWSRELRAAIEDEGKWANGCPHCTNNHDPGIQCRYAPL